MTINRHDQIKFIKEACIAKNPRIKDLEFGCVFVHKGLGYQITIPELSPLGFKYRTTEGHTFTEKEIQESVITGRAIRLSDILVLLGDNYSVNGMGRFEEWESFESPDKYKLVHYSLSKWNLLEDNLENQQNDIIEFIYNIIK